MKTLNRVTLLGNAAADPETRQTAGGLGVTSLSVATTNKWKDKNSGEWKEKGEFHRCVLFGKLSDIADEYITKGTQLFVEGRLQTRSWDKDGVKQWMTEIVVTDFQMLGSRQQPAPHKSTTNGEDKAQEMFDDPIPF